MEKTKIKGWLVRDKDDFTAVYGVKPTRGKTEWCDGAHPHCAGESSFILSFGEYMFPDVKFEDEPIEVEITIKPCRENIE